MNNESPNLAGVDLNLLTAFDALMRERHVTRAATRVGLAQPSMSNALTRLRHLFGDDLFTRTPQGMVPTPRAEAIAPHIAAALEATRRALDTGTRFDPATHAFTIRMAATDLVEFVALPALLSALRTRAPMATLRILPFDRARTAGQIDAQDIDLALSRLGEVPKRQFVETLYPERFVVLSRAGDAPASLDSFLARPHALFAPAGDATGMVDAALAKIGRERRVQVTVSSFTALPFLIAATDLISVVPATLARKAAEIVPLAVSDPPVGIAGFDMQITWGKATDSAPEHRWFRDLLREVLAP